MTFIFIQILEFTGLIVNFHQRTLYRNPVTLLETTVQQDFRKDFLIKRQLFPQVKTHSSFR